MSFDKIPGEALCGFADFFEEPRGGVVVGAEHQLKLGKPSPSKGWKRAVINKKTAQTKHPAHSARPLARSAKKAQVAINKAIATLKKPKKVVNRKGKVLGDLDDVLGDLDAAVGAPPSSGKKSVTPKQQAAVNKAKQAAKKADDAGKKLKASAIKALKAGKQARAMARTVVKTFKVGKAQRGRRAGIRGDVDLWGDDLLGQEDGGEDLSDLEGGGDTPAEDIKSGLGGGALPTIPLHVPIDATVLAPFGGTIPADAIRFSGSLARYDVGSFWYWHGPNRKNTDRPADGSHSGMTGFIWGWNHANFPNNNMSPRWILRTGNGDSGNDNWDDGFGNKDDPNAINNAEVTAEVSQLSISGFRSERTPLREGPDIGKLIAATFVPVLHHKVLMMDGGGGDLTSQQVFKIAPPWGPLIGNPNNPRTKNLRWSIPDRTWFWFLEEAPEAVLAPMKMAAAKAKVAAEEAARAAAEVEAQNKAKEAADAAAEEAALAAQEALAERGREEERKQSEHELSQQEQREAAEQRKRDAEAAEEERKAAAEERRQMMESEAEARRAEAEERKLMLEQASDDRKFQAEQRRLMLERAASQPQQPIDAEYEDVEQPLPDSGGGGAGDEYDPEAAAAAEADSLEGILGALDLNDTLRETIVGADGQPIMDKWGNALE